jgi:hypothetical protein
LVVQIVGNAANWASGQSYSYRVATATSLGAPVLINTQSQFDTTQLSNFAGGTFTLQSVGNDLILSFQPVPEPGSMLLIGAVALAAVGARRRRAT